MKADFDSFAGSYDRLLDEAIPAGLSENEYFARYKIDLIARLSGSASTRRVLDFGCGSGRSLVCLRRAFPEAKISGYDPSSRSLELAAKALPDATLTDDWASLEPGTFDCVLAANVLHHVPVAERVATLSRCASLLSPAGALHVFEHNPRNPVTRRVFERCVFDRDAHMIDRSDMFSLGREAGLRVLSTRFTLFFPRQLALFRPLEGWLGKVPLGAQYFVQFVR